MRDAALMFASIVASLLALVIFAILVFCLIRDWRNRLTPERIQALVEKVRETMNQPGDTDD